ncbi:hypothetical protein CCACVL1_25012 [Corchorus capsularis]|uniref:Uncharacterized protein n=1 Tax=Corchorus capsularis TaxID=210143 RepID=A0A1R3GM78_COCAP|nr:hypothetical protein CCACVL1_25012 [Corchorus capsularis]
MTNTESFSYNKLSPAVLENRFPISSGVPNGANESPAAAILIFNQQFQGMASTKTWERSKTFGRNN